MKNPKFVQIVPVAGWFVHYDRTDNEGEYAASQPVLSLALTADGKIVGVVDGAGIDFAERQVSRACTVRYSLSKKR